MATLSLCALNPVIVFPNASWAVRVFTPVNTVELAWGDVREKANLLRDAGSTLIGNGTSAVLPSVTVRLALSTLYRVREMAPPDPVARPLANEINVGVPSDTAMLFLSVTVGAVTGLLEGLAPEKVSIISPL